MVRPIPVVAFVVVWHFVFAALALSDPQPEDTAGDPLECSIVDVLTGCSDTFNSIVFGTVPCTDQGCPPVELNQVIIIIDFIILAYFLWTLIVLVRGGAAD